MIQRIPLLNALDRWFLVNLPYIWTTRVHLVAPAGSIAFLSFALLGYALPPEGSSTLDVILTIGLMATTILTFYWTYVRVRRYSCLPFMQPRLARIDVIVSVICLISINAGPIIFAEIYGNRVDRWSLVVNAPAFWTVVLIVGFEILAFLAASRGSPARSVGVTLALLLAASLGITIVLASFSVLVWVVAFLCCTLYLCCFLLTLFQPKPIKARVLFCAVAIILFVTPRERGPNIFPHIVQPTSLSDSETLAAVAWGCCLYALFVSVLEGRPYPIAREASLSPL